MNNEETFYQAMRRQGVTRRSFLKYCSLAATSLGLGAGMAPKIAWALENKPRIPVVWIHGLECTCCTESFIRSAHPLAKDVILSLISLDYDDTLMAAAGTQAEEVFEDIITQYNGKYILAVEGNPPLGEQGNNLSVGQKQLLALARVLVETPQILILDEATASIDSGTEQAIQHALAAGREHTTLVVIAHRLSTIVDADTILVLHRGQAVEQGTHQQLLAAQGRYWQMYQLQLAGEELAASVREEESLSA